MLEFPAATMVRFCDNHGLLQVNDRPQWFTVKGGSQHYVKAVTSRVANKHLRTPVLSVERDADGVTLHTVSGSQRFDQVVLACHADQALQTLAAPSADEQSVLSAIRFQDNLAVLHTDTSVMPDRKLAWAAWNYQRLSDAQERSGVCLHYWLNKLQPLPFSQDVFVSLNPLTDIDPSQVLGQFHYTHPVFDLAAIQAQRRMGPLQGQQHTWFAGAWMGYGFHEDGYKAGRAAAQSIVQGIMQEEVA
jgi:predicted NAD/FAD-binding protein